MNTPPPLLPGYQANFQTLQRAAEYGDLALVSAIRAADQMPVALVCAIQTNDDGTFTPVPLAEMCSGNPFEDYLDPTI